MYAIVEIAGQQFKVEKDQEIFVHRLEGDAGSAVEFDNVLLLDNDGKVTVGTPTVNGALIKAKIIEHLKGDKVIVFHKKRRKGYQKQNGHRQYLSKLVIEDVLAKGAKTVKKEVAKAESKAEKKETKPKAAPKKAVEAKVEKPKAAPKKEAKPKAEVKATPKKTVKKETVAKTTAKKEVKTAPKAEAKKEAKPKAPAKPKAEKKAEPKSEDKKEDTKS